MLEGLFQEVEIVLHCLEYLDQRSGGVLNVMDDHVGEHFIAFDDLTLQLHSLLQLLN